MITHRGKTYTPLPLLTTVMQAQSGTNGCVSVDVERHYQKAAQGGVNTSMPATESEPTNGTKNGNR